MFPATINAGTPPENRANPPDPKIQCWKICWVLAALPTLNQGGLGEAIDDLKRPEGNAIYLLYSHDVFARSAQHTSSSRANDVEFKGSGEVA